MTTKGKLAEKQVLKKLGVEKFEDLNKDHVITLSSMLDQMDPETAKKVLENFPEYANAMKNAIQEFTQFLENGLESNDESVKAIYDSCEYVIKALEKELEKENLTFEEKMKINEQMITVIREMNLKDSENKRFIIAMTFLGKAALGVSALALLSLLGVDSKINIKGLKRIVS